MHMYAQLSYQLKDPVLYLSGSLDQRAITEAVRRHEPQAIYFGVSENIAWDVLRQEILTNLSPPTSEIQLKPLTINLSEIEKIDSIGLAALIHLIATASQVREPVQLEGLGTHILQLVEIYNLKSVLNPYLSSNLDEKPAIIEN